MELKLYNTLSKQKEVFKPINDDKVRMYSCGPTVYYYAHIGNLRTYLFMDNLRRVLKYNGYNLLHAMNITDVGHLVSDADEGEDKMAVAAKRENKDPYEIAEFYTNRFMGDLQKLNIGKPEIICKATEHIKEMEEYVLQIIKNGYTYETENTIYFDTSKLDKYGLLSNIKVEEQKAGARVDFDKEKKNVTDFALWIKAPENHIMKWDTFWGKCYPGWHIECSAMGRKYLGDHFDIHTGGIDHIPIHHENEIAQSKGCTGKIPANFWMHSEFLLIDGGKMSKSLNNVYTISDLEAKGFSAMDYRMFNFTSHYRNKLNFTWDSLESAKIALNRLKEGYQKHEEGIEQVSNEKIEGYKQKFNEAINDDLNMPLAMSVVWEVIKENNKSKQYAELLRKFDEVLGLEINKKVEIELPEEVKKLVEERKLARLNKDWAKSDELRDKIDQMGYSVKDTKDGMEITK
ncbi:MAG: cysteine--tRNA ligase [Clostridia bacterium]|jgi:cysteinyl-tRNA synthetase|nr:cysteine--tRNA ligase [Clostridia bacterium]